MIKQFFIIGLFITAIKSPAQLKIISSANKLYSSDWLVRAVQEKAEVYKSTDGKDIILTYRHTQSSLKDLLIKVHYAIYNGLPLIAKWVTVENKGTATFKI